jgi:glutathione S-transferase
VIYHIASAADWQRAQVDGEYRTSTRGRSLEQQGFIHASDLHQLLPTADLIYGDEDPAGLIVLVIDPAQLAAGVDVKYEPVPGAPDPFPHIFGPITPAAVTETFPLTKDEQGRFRHDHHAR